LTRALSEGDAAEERNMPLDCTQYLNWLHDCGVDSIFWSGFGPREPRVLEITIWCPEDLGVPELNGRKAKLVAVDVLACKHVLYPVDAIETVGSVGDGVSEDLQVALPNVVRHTIAFSTGAVIQLVCRKLQLVRTD
jgi:hypothetical protein